MILIHVVLSHFKRLSSLSTVTYSDLFIANLWQTFWLYKFAFGSLCSPLASQRQVIIHLGRIVHTVFTQIASLATSLLQTLGIWMLTWLTHNSSNVLWNVWNAYGHNFTPRFHSLAKDNSQYTKMSIVFILMFVKLSVPLPVSGQQLWVQFWNFYVLSPAYSRDKTTGGVPLTGNQSHFFSQPAHCVITAGDPTPWLGWLITRVLIIIGGWSEGGGKERESKFIRSVSLPPLECVCGCSHLSTCTCDGLCVCVCVVSDQAAISQTTMATRF